MRDYIYGKVFQVGTFAYGKRPFSDGRDSNVVDHDYHPDVCRVIDLRDYAFCQTGAGVMSRVSPRLRLVGQAGLPEFLRVAPG